MDQILTFILIFAFAFIGGHVGTRLAIKIELHNAKVRDEWKARKAYLESLDSRP
jgi:hypothetical protein